MIKELTDANDTQEFMELLEIIKHKNWCDTA